MTKIKYNKSKSGRILMGGGPRDIQLKQRLAQAELIKRKINITDGAVVEEPIKSKIDLSQYLPLDEVKEKIESAVEFTKKREKEIREKDNQKIIEKDLTIAKLISELSVKDEVYMNLQIKMDKIYERISNGSIKSLVGSNISRPMLEDKIFIDPLEKETDSDLDSHINIEEDKILAETSERDIKTDLDKLRGLLKV